MRPLFGEHFRWRRWLQVLLLSMLTLTTVIWVSSNLAPLSAQTPTKLKFGVGPYFPTPGESRKQFQPLFEELAKQVGLPGDVTVTEDWIGISVALRSRTLDAAWLGPWGYVLANHNDPSIQAIATVKYKDKPTYFSVLMARADAPFNTLDEAIAISRKNNKKLKLSLADVGSTSGWLIPQAEFKRRKLNPKTVFDYSEGASHAAQAISVLSRQTDIASDYDRNLDVLASQGRIDRSKLKIIWRSQPLPNDPIAVRGNFPPALRRKLQSALVNMPPEKAKRLLPPNYTGFIRSDGRNYQPIQAAGKLVGKLK